MNVDPLLRAREGAALLGVSLSTFWRHVESGMIPPPVKIGGSSRWPQSDIQSVIEKAKSNREAGQ